ncbi:SMI1/KNR4 family protein [Roseateles sp.]|uniref:SMI1/KNR4 family protein n=1 Tax=Roseateles sp. TaxID=1971397 RepID=UPI003D0ADA6A
MPIDLREFWGTNYYNHPPLTDEMVAIAEARLGVTLPVLLVDLLRMQNGGYTKGFAHPMTERTTWSDDHVPLDDLAGIVIGAAAGTPQNLLHSETMRAEWGIPPKQVLLSGDGHYWLTLDYRSGPAPVVSWIDVECGEDLRVASSFEEFVNGLVPAESYEV